MRERPVLFNTQMVSAILDGRKTQTRRLCRAATLSTDFEEIEPGLVEFSTLHGDGPGHDVHEAIYRRACPYGAPGDRLWVREAFSPRGITGEECSIGDSSFVVFRGGGQKYRDGAYFAPLAQYAPGASDHIRYRPSIHMPRWASRILLEVTEVRVERMLTLELWDRVYGEGAARANPWVWAVTFRVVA